jgi:hypothetical protein
MARGLLEVLRFFFLALVWLFVAYALRTTVAELRRGRLLRAAQASVMGPLERAAAGVPRPLARLRLVEPPEERGRIVELIGEVTLGRSPSCGASFERDSFASSFHARIFSRDGQLWVEDLGSTNGTFVNEERVGAPARLRRGDRLRVGRTVLEVMR